MSRDTECLAQNYTQADAKPFVPSVLLPYENSSEMGGENLANVTQSYGAIDQAACTSEAELNTTVRAGGYVNLAADIHPSGQPVTPQP